MTDSKKKWVKPELIILLRSNPAEAVLGACKGATGWQSVSTLAQACFGYDSNTCGASCSDMSAS